MRDETASVQERDALHVEDNVENDVIETTTPQETASEPGGKAAKLGLVSTLAVATAACGGGGGGGSGTSGGGAPPTGGGGGPSAPPVVTPQTDNEAARFLLQASLSASTAEISELRSEGFEPWLDRQMSRQNDQTARSFYSARGYDVVDNEHYFFNGGLSDNMIWSQMLSGGSGVRKRAALALSEFIVVSANSVNLTWRNIAMGHYWDILNEHAFGNYRDLIEAITLNPAMGVFLNTRGNRRADPSKGRVPDENYAREILQLFTIGLVQLNQDGTPTLDGQGEPIELYDNDDITGLAKVFTGLSISGINFNAPLRLIPFEGYYEQLDMFDDFHSLEEKTFLGETIPAGTAGDESIDRALDIIFEHPNIGPFIGRQLIQRFVTSHPTPAYVARVADAFDSGRYTLPTGEQVGDGNRGALDATLAAILFDEEARDENRANDPGYGKLREPVLRFTHWARAFEINSADASNEIALKNTGSSEALGQNPYGANSVFNFYRPGYIAPGTATGDAELTAPELQIENAGTVIGYPNFLTIYALGVAPQFDRNAPQAYLADYAAETALAEDANALLDHLDLLLTHGRLADDTRQTIIAALDEIPPTREELLLARAQLASVMVMTAPEYIVLR